MDMTIDATKQRDGFLAPYDDQELRWLVPDKFAAARRGGAIEIFQAIPDKRTTCGFRFKFVYHYSCFEQAASMLPPLLAETKNLTQHPKWVDLINVFNSVTSDVFWSRDIIGRGWGVTYPSRRVERIPDESSEDLPDPN